MTFVTSFVTPSPHLMTKNLYTQTPFPTWLTFETQSPPPHPVKNLVVTSFLLRLVLHARLSAPCTLHLLHRPPLGILLPSLVSLHTTFTQASAAHFSSPSTSPPHSHGGEGRVFEDYVPRRRRKRRRDTSRKRRRKKRRSRVFSGELCEATRGNRLQFFYTSHTYNIIIIDYCLKVPEIHCQHLCQMSPCHAYPIIPTLVTTAASNLGGRFAWANNIGT